METCAVSGQTSRGSLASRRTQHPLPSTHIVSTSMEAWPLSLPCQSMLLMDDDGLHFRHNPQCSKCSSTSTNQTNILCLDSLCPGNFGKRTSGALQIEHEGQRIGKTYKSHFPIFLHIQFHTRRRTLNTLRAIQPSQTDLPASSINRQQRPEQSYHAIKPARALYADHSPH